MDKSSKAWGIEILAARETHKQDRAFSMSWSTWGRVTKRPHCSHKFWSFIHEIILKINVKKDSYYLFPSSPLVYLTTLSQLQELYGASGCDWRMKMDMGGNRRGLFLWHFLERTPDQSKWPGWVESLFWDLANTLHWETLDFVSSCLGGGGMRPYVLPRLAAALPAVYMTNTARFSLDLPL